MCAVLRRGLTERASERRLMPRGRHGLPVARILLLTTPLWGVAALILQRNVLWQFDRAVWGGEIDGTFNLWSLAWVYRALTTAPLALFDANIFYPALDTLALGDHRVANQLFFAPAYALTGSPIVAVNVHMTTQFVLAALAAMLLAQRLFGSWSGAVVAGAMFTFSPTRLSAHLDRPNLLVAFWTPLALYFLDRFLESRSWRDLGGCSACLAFQFLTGFYHGYFLLVAMAVWVLGSAWWRPRSVCRLSVLTKGALGAGIAGALIAPFSLPYLRVRSHYQALEEPLEVLVEASATLTSYMAARPANPLYASLLNPTQSGFFAYAGEKWLFPGVLCLGLAILGLGLLRRDGLRGRVGLVWGLVVVAFLLSLGPRVRLGEWTLPGPYLLLWHAVPGFASLRVPARFGMVVAFGLSLSAAAGYRWLDERLTGRRWVRAGVFALALGTALTEAFLATPPRAATLPTPAEVPEEYRWLATHGDGALLELPARSPRGGPDLETAILELTREVRYLYFSVYHWRPMVNGYSGHVPKPAYDVHERVAGFPSEDSVRYLGAIGVRQVLVHPEPRLAQHLEVARRGGLVEEVRQFASGSRLVALAQPRRSEAVTIRVLVPTQAPAGGDLDLALLFGNAGPDYWVNSTQRACRVETSWRASGVSPDPSVSFVLPPAALAPGEIGDRVLRVRAPERSGPTRLASRVTCPRGGGVAAAGRSAEEVVFHERMETGETRTAGLEARYLGHYVPRHGCGGCRLVVRLHVRNTGSLVWTRRGLVRLGLRWMTSDGRMLSQERVLLERDVYPGQEVVVGGTIPTPREPGTYLLELDLLQELKTWFAELGSTPVRVAVTLS